METCSLLAAAKINLYLEIIGDRADGYHELAMIMQSVNFADRLTLRKLSVDEIRVQSNHPELPTDDRNLAYQTVELMWQQFPDAVQSHGGGEILIEKNIPIGAGLAGGSANAAAVLVGLNLLWNLGLTYTELQVLGEKLGADVPFCVMGGTAIATGRGERLAPLNNNNHLYVVLAKHRNLSVATPWAYQTFRDQFSDTYISDPVALKDRWHQVQSSSLVTALNHHDTDAIGRHLHNDFEKIVLPAHPQVAQLRETLNQLSPLGAIMSGSGPTVFALATSVEEAKRISHQAKEKLNDPTIDFWIAQFVSSGVKLI